MMLSATIALPAAAQAGTIRGTVSDSAGAGLANAAVTVEGTTLRAVSGSGGGYEIRGVPAGTQTVRVRLIGYRAESAEVTVTATDATTQDFTLLRSPVQLAPIDVVVGSRARHTAEDVVDRLPDVRIEMHGIHDAGIAVGLPDHIAKGEADICQRRTEALPAVGRD